MRLFIYAFMRISAGTHLVVSAMIAKQYARPPPSFPPSRQLPASLLANGANQPKAKFFSSCLGDLQENKVSSPKVVSK